MKLEDQVVSLPLAKRLKELGVKQNANFFWSCNGFHGTGEPIEPWKFSRRKTYDQDIAAFTVAELGEMLPESIGIGDDHAHLHIALGTRLVGKWTIGYASFSRSGQTDIIDEKKEADARAKMLIYLLEKCLVKP